MKRLTLCLLAALFVGLPAPVPAGMIIRFQDAPATHSDVVLANVPVKALIAEFLDPGDTGLGKSLGYLAWREILTAISDQAGAGAILARAPDGLRLTDLLEQAYHESAVRITREQQAGMVLWGAVNAAGGDVYISTYLSILPEAAKLQPKLRLVAEPPLPPGLEAGIERTNFNFPQIETTRMKLFQRAVVTRKEVVLRAAADASSAPVGQAKKETALEVVDMEKGWFKVRLAEGRFGYVDHSMVDVPPPTVDARVTLGLSTSPAASPGPRIVLNGSHRVLDMRYVEGKGLWYELAVGQKRGWVPASRVSARFTLPIVHFAAGLYRYQFKRYEDARREFIQYATAKESAGDNPSLATAYQLTGASMLLAQKSVFETHPDTLKEFTKAIAVTPYDPAAYSLRALSTLAFHQQFGPALPDLEQALRLDPADKTASRIAGALARELKSGGGSLQMILRDTRDPAPNQRLADLLRRFPAAASPVP